MVGIVIFLVALVAIIFFLSQRPTSNRDPLNRAPSGTSLSSTSDDDLNKRLTENLKCNLQSRELAFRESTELSSASVSRSLPVNKYLEPFDDLQCSLFSALPSDYFYENALAAIPPFILVVSRLILIFAKKLHQGDKVLDNELLSAAQGLCSEEQILHFSEYAAYYEGFLKNDSPLPRCEFAFSDQSIIKSDSLIQILVASLCDAIVNPLLVREGPSAPVVLHDFDHVFAFTDSFMSATYQALQDYIPILTNL